MLLLKHSTYYSQSHSTPFRVFQSSRLSDLPPLHLFYPSFTTYVHLHLQLIEGTGSSAGNSGMTLTLSRSFLFYTHNSFGGFFFLVGGWKGREGLIFSFRVPEYPTCLYIIIYK